MKKTIFLIAVLFFTTSSFAQVTDQLVVEGKSSVKLAPEQFIFNVRISVTDSNYTQCANLALQEAEKITGEFTQNGIDKELIKTRNYSIREIREHDYQTRKSVFKGYRAEIPVTIKTRMDNDKNDLIFEIIKNNFGANFSLNFALTPEQTEEVKEKLIALAVEDAKHKAKVISESASVKLGKISNIQYGEPRLLQGIANRNYELQTEQLMVREASAKGGTSVLNPSEIEMRTNIIISWLIEE